MAIPGLFPAMLDSQLRRISLYYGADNKLALDEVYEHVSSVSPGNGHVGVDVDGAGYGESLRRGVSCAGNRAPDNDGRAYYILVSVTAGDSIMSTADHVILVISQLGLA